MGKKTPGKLGAPPAQSDFDALPLGTLTRTVEGTFYRLHSLNTATGAAWDPLHFSSRGTSRFDPIGGKGTLYLAAEPAGALMEVFDDRWGPIGSLGRSVTNQELKEWWVTAVDVAPIEVFDATGRNLSKLGTDAQLLTGDYPTTQLWAQRLMDHPQNVGGILYRSRHDPTRLDVALFGRAGLLPARLDPLLDAAGMLKWTRQPSDGLSLVHGPAVLLEQHPDLSAALSDLAVAVLP